MLLLDTNILIDVLRGEAAALAWQAASAAALNVLDRL
jgi:predicted nucleic acid-binding protein